MFGRLNQVRIRAAQEALAEGRLDDAFEALRAPDLSENRQVLDLREQLSEAYLDRGQERMLDRAFEAARGDFARAGMLNPTADRPQQWIERAEDAMTHDRVEAARTKEAAAEARRRMEAGSLHGAAAAVEALDVHSPEREHIEDEIDRRGSRATRLMDAARAALKKGRPAEAVRDLQEAKQLDARLDGLNDLIDKTVSEVVKIAEKDFAAGRVDDAENALVELGELGKHDDRREALSDALRVAREIADALRNEDFDNADILLGRLDALGIKTPWAKTIRDQVRTIETQRRALLQGPLGMLIGNFRRERTTEARRPIDDTLDAGQRKQRISDGPPPILPRSPVDVKPNKKGVPSRLIMRVDGVGSFLLLTKDRIGIGRSGPGATADVQLVSDLSERHAEVIRAGEDYFMVSQRGVELGNDKSEHALLQDGDRLRLSKRIRLTFRKPSLKSQTAQLELGEGVRLPTECRSILLWAGPLLLGNTRECHVRLPATMGDCVLVQREDGLFIKPMRGAGRKIQIGEPVQIGELSLRVSEA